MQTTLLLEGKHQVLVFLKLFMLFCSLVSSPSAGEGADLVIPIGQWVQGRKARSLSRGQESKQCGHPTHFLLLAAHSAHLPETFPVSKLKASHSRKASQARAEGDNWSPCKCAF